MLLSCAVKHRNNNNDYIAEMYSRGPLHSGKPAFSGVLLAVRQHAVMGRKYANIHILYEQSSLRNLNKISVIYTPSLVAMLIQIANTYTELDVHAIVRMCGWAWEPRTTLLITLGLHGRTYVGI